MKKKYLPLIALAVGFVWALLATGVHSLFFCLLPVLAFAFGYFSSKKAGLLCGFLLLLGYSTTIVVIERGFYPFPNIYELYLYTFEFTLGGFSLPLLGAAAPFARRGIRKVSAIVVLAGLIVVVSWFGYQSWPTYNHYYQIVVHTSEDVKNLELFTPLPYVDEALYEELLENPIWNPKEPTFKYTGEIMETEHGPMLKLTVPNLMEEESSGIPSRGYPYIGNIIFHMHNTSHDFIHIKSRYDVTAVNSKEFKAPLMVKSDTEAEFELEFKVYTMWNERVSFSLVQFPHYTELIRYEGSIGDDWLLVPVEVTID